MHLPSALDPRDFDEHYRLSFDAWREAVVELCAEHGLSCASIRPFEEGSNLVADVESRWVVKLFPPFHRHQWESERSILPRFSGALPLETPSLIAEGARPDGYNYLILTYLEGRTLEEAWGEMSSGARVRIMNAIGRSMASAHRVPIDGLADLPPRFDDFIAAQRAGCRDRHTQLGAPRWLTAGLEDFVAEHLDAIDLGPPHVILTGEYTPFNLLVAQSPDGPRLSGMIDFGDAMIGPAAYDLLGPIAFLAAGRPRLLEALFEGYDAGAATRRWPLDTAQRNGLLALLLLHRYSNLDAQLRMAGWRQAGSLEALADLIFGV